MSELQIMAVMYEASKWIGQKVEKLPRSYRFTLGDRLVNTALDLYLLLVEGKPSSPAGTGKSTPSCVLAVFGRPEAAITRQERIKNAARNRQHQELVQLKPSKTIGFQLFSDG